LCTRSALSCVLSCVAHSRSCVVYKDIVHARRLQCCTCTEIDDFMDQCEAEDDHKNQKYSECFALYDNGMLLTNMGVYRTIFMFSTYILAVVRAETMGLKDTAVKKM